MILSKVIILIFGLHLIQGVPIFDESYHNPSEKMYSRILKTLVPLILAESEIQKRNNLPVLIFAETSNDDRNSIAKYFNKIPYQISLEYFEPDSDVLLLAFCKVKSHLIILHRLDYKYIPVNKFNNKISMSTF